MNHILAHNSHYLGAHTMTHTSMPRVRLRANGQAVRGTLTSGANFGQKTLSLMVMAKTAFIRGQIEMSLEHLDDSRRTYYSLTIRYRRALASPSEPARSTSGSVNWSSDTAF